MTLLSRCLVRLVALLGLVVFAGIASADPEDYRPGDLIFIKIPTSFGRAVEELTAADVSHVGIVAAHDSGHLTVVHALGKVQEEPLERFLERGKGHFAVSRYTFRSAEDVTAFITAARSFLGWPYDHHFLIDNQAIYCSELVYRAFLDGLGLTPVPLTPMHFGKPGTDAYRVMERITGGRIPEGEPGCSPGDYFTSSEFRPVETQL